jgi:hypothetical protein
MLHRFELHSTEKKGELRCIELKLLAARAMPGDFVSATFQSLVKNRESVSVPPEYLDAVATPIEKEKHMPVEHVSIEYGLDGGAESIEPLA